MKHEQDVEITKGDGLHADTIAEHPAFAQIEIVRTTTGGSKNILYGSDFDHRSSISLTVYTSRLHRSLSGDRHHAGEELLRLEMSEAQFASIASFVGLGGGMPVTLRRFNGELIPAIPAPTERSDQFRQEVKGTLDRTRSTLAETIAKIDALPISEKKKAELRHDLKTTSDNLEKNVAFVAERFSEHMEETVLRAKQEITTFAQRMGVVPPGLPGASPAMQEKQPLPAKRITRGKK